MKASAAVILAAFLSLSTAAETAHSAQEVAGCLVKDGMWSSVDGTKFYFCVPGTDTVIEQTCRRNRFFVNNATVAGCVKLDMVSSNCIYHSEVEPEPCIGANLLQPQPSKHPTKFYVCTGQDTNPVKLTCNSGKAFVKQDGYLGCFEWDQWRQIKNCTE